MDDLISREDAIDAIYEHEFANWCDKDEVSTVLNDLPSAQPERKRGLWIDDNCSECGQYVYHGNVRNFCPNCGADMRGNPRLHITELEGQDEKKQ